MPAKLSLLALAAICGLLQGCASQPAQPRDLAFDVRLLSGWWSDSTNTSAACVKANPRIRYAFSADGRRVELQFDRKWDTEIGEADRFGAQVLAATERTLLIQYDNESRLDSASQPMKWELAVVAPGIYRWHASEWPPGVVNVVVGVKCGDA